MTAQAIEHIDTIQVPYWGEKINENIVAHWGSLEGMSGRQGAYYGCADSYGTTLAHALVGTVSDPEKRARYSRIVQKKLYDLSIIIEASDSEKMTSRAIAEAMVERYAGAIAGDEGLWAVSGYTGDVDELAALALAYALDDISQVDATRLARNNPLREMLDELLALIDADKAQDD